MFHRNIRHQTTLVRNLFHNNRHKIIPGISFLSIFIGALSYCYRYRENIHNIMQLNVYSNLYSLCESSNTDDNGKSMYLSQKELMNELNKRLKLIRQRLSKQGKPTPEMIVASSNVFEIRFELDNNVNIAELLKFWLKVLINSNSTSSSNNNNNKAISSPPLFRFQNGSLNVLSNDKNSKLIWYSDQHGHITSIQKYPGFTITDIDNITKGYEDVLLSYFTYDSSFNNSNNSNNQTKGYFIHEPDNRNDVPNDILRAIFKNIFPTFPNGNNDDSDNSNDDYNFNYVYGPNNGDNTQIQDNNKKNIATNPIDKLRNLGVQVINHKDNNNTNTNNNNNNQTLTWDHLAGYEDIKRQIEDTVINSFLYADIYDQVTKTTRLDFESNRPTAILLTGPPGVWSIFNTLLCCKILIFN